MQHAVLISFSPTSPHDYETDIYDLIRPFNCFGGVETPISRWDSWHIIAVFPSSFINSLLPLLKTCDFFDGKTWHTFEEGTNGSLTVDEKKLELRFYDESEDIETWNLKFFKRFLFHLPRQTYLALVHFHN